MKIETNGMQFEFDINTTSGDQARSTIFMSENIFPETKLEVFEHYESKTPGAKLTIRGEWEIESFLKACALAYCYEYKNKATVSLIDLLLQEL